MRDRTAPAAVDEHVANGGRRPILALRQQRLIPLLENMHATASIYLHESGGSAARPAYFGLILVILLPWMPSPAISPFWPKMNA